MYRLATIVLRLASLADSPDHLSNFLHALEIPPPRGCNHPVGSVAASGSCLCGSRMLGLHYDRKQFRRTNVYGIDESIRIHRPSLALP